MGYLDPKVDTSALWLTKSLQKYMDPCGAQFQSEVAVDNATQKAVAPSLLILDVCLNTSA